jgi:hypothetical protein
MSSAIELRGESDCDANCANRQNQGKCGFNLVPEFQPASGTRGIARPERGHTNFNAQCACKRISRDDAPTYTVLPDT